MTRFSKSTREQVQKRAGARCEYCRKPDAFSSQAPHIDHIIALKHKGTDDLDNLAWACFQCNLCKGTDIASIDDVSGEITRLYNPRTQQWDDHFELDTAKIVGKTAVGRVTITLLQINDPDQIETRQILLDNDLWT